MLVLRDFKPEKLIAGVELAKKSLHLTFKYLANELNIFSYDYLPYEGQFLTILCVASSCDNDFPNWLKEWFWTVSFSEGMQGKTDVSIANNLINVRNNHRVKLNEYLTIHQEDVYMRTIIKGASLGMAVISSLIKNNASSIFNCKTIDPEEFMSSFKPKSLGSVFSKAELTNVIKPIPRGNRQISNIILLELSKRIRRPSPRQVRASIILLSKTVSGRNALNTQCIDEKCIDAIKSNDADRFLTVRSENIIKLAKSLCVK